MAGIVQRMTVDKIRYLAFQGGGGKGFAHLGAIQYLESQNKLPNNQSMNSPILGVAGASAGALTAFFVAMGYTAVQIRKALQNLDPYDEKITPEAMDEYQALGLDPPPPKPTVGIARSLGPRGRLSYKSLTKRPSNWEYAEARYVAAYIITLVVSADIAAFVKGQTQSTNPLYKYLDYYTKESVSCLAFDFGLMSGKSLRRFLQTELENFIKSNIDPKDDNASLSADLLTIEQFQNLTKMEFVVTGTNVSKSETKYLRAGSPANFPVLDAVVISASIPPIFKPTWLDKSYGEEFEGFWADGGLITNFPLHAFDQHNYSPSRPPNRSTNDSKSMGILPLNPTTFGFQLITGMGNPIEVKQPGKLGIGEYLGLLLGAGAFGASDGQVRSPEEAIQTLKLPCGSLDTVQFTPADNDIDNAISVAFNITKAYFEGKNYSG